MKKAIAIILVLSMAVLFASCKKEEPENPTGETLGTLAVGTPSVQEPGQTTESTSAKPEEPMGETMILTTNYGETMPTVVTTIFNPANETTEATVPVSFEIPVMTAPVVNTSSIPTTAKPTTTTTATAHTEPTEGKSEGDGSDTAGKTRKALEFANYGISDSNNVTVEFEANGWNGGVKTGKFSATVKTDTGKTGSVVGRVIGIQNGDGYFSVVIPVDDFVTDDVSSLNITIPAGAVASRNGDQTSKAFTAKIATNS